MILSDANKNIISGFEICGVRQSDGKILLGYSEPKILVDDYPKEITLFNITYTLEDVKLNDDDGTLPETHPGKHFEFASYC